MTSRGFASATASLLAILAISGCTTTPSARHSGPGNAASTGRLHSPTTAGQTATTSCLQSTPSGPASGVRWQVPAATPVPAGAPGAIAGHIVYPSSEIRPQLVYAINATGPADGAYATETVWQQDSYSIQGVAPGIYYVYSAVRPLICTSLGTIFAAAYTDFVKCGLINGCSAHTLLQVAVRSNATTAGIDVEDWYADPLAAYPPPPLAIVPPAFYPQFTPAPYGSARDAGAATSGQPALLVDRMSACPVNRACVSIGQEHDGIQAAYFIGETGSNTDVLACGIYVYEDSSGAWRGLRSFCGPGPVFPAAGQSGAVWLGLGVSSGCVNVRASPGPSGTVTDCLKVGTQVRIDDGPAYSPMAFMDGIWWHVVGRGWIADDYLR